MPEYNVGDEVRVKAASFPRPDGTLLTRGQTIELTEDDLNRSDIQDLVEPLDPSELEDPDEGVIDEQEPPESLDFNSPSMEALVRHLQELNVVRAKKFLSDERWTLEGMRIAREAERTGKNRQSVVDYADGRILDLEDEDTEQAPA